jgi:glycosyltransferase involved in cell wall biosynthesis
LYSKSSIVIAPTPIISVVIPARNYAPFITFAVESLLDQDYEGELEIIVVDDGSTDETRTILQKYAGRIIYRYLEHKGVAVARNEGISLARGEIITFLDADDVWDSSRVRRVAEAFNDNPDIGIVFHNFAVIDTNGSTLVKDYYEAFHPGMKREGPLLSGIIDGNVFCGGSSFSFRGELLREHYPIPEDIRRGVDFYLTAITSCRARAVYLPAVLGKYRLHQNNLTFVVDADKSRPAEIHRDLSCTYEKLLVRLPRIASVSQEDLKTLTWRLNKSILLFSALSGKRIDALKKLPVLFKSSGSFDTLLPNVGLTAFVLFAPRIFYTYLVRLHFFGKRVVQTVLIRLK